MGTVLAVFDETAFARPDERRTLRMLCLFQQHRGCDQ
jgi:hypothetical protein